jgi:hypothetical protein
MAQHATRPFVKKTRDFRNGSISTDWAFWAMSGLPPVATELRTIPDRQLRAKHGHPPSMARQFVKSNQI